MGLGGEGGGRWGLTQLFIMFPPQTNKRNQNTGSAVHGHGADGLPLARARGDAHARLRRGQPPAAHQGRWVGGCRLMFYWWGGELSIHVVCREDAPCVLLLFSNQSHQYHKNDTPSYTSHHTTPTGRLRLLPLPGARRRPAHGLQRLQPPAGMYPYHTIPYHTFGARPPWLC